MLILGKKGLSGIVKYILDLIFIGGIGIFISLPFSLKWYLNYIILDKNEKYWFLLPFLYVTGFFALMILNELRKIFKTLNKKNPFSIDNVKSLNRMAVASIIISITYIAKIILFNSFLTIIISMVFIIAGLFSIILGEVFRQAVIVKEENELTI